MREFLNTDRWTMLGKAPPGRRNVVVSLHRTPKYEAMLEPRSTAGGRQGRVSTGWPGR
jgi:hypothetical protein